MCLDGNLADDKMINYSTVSVRRSVLEELPDPYNVRSIKNILTLPDRHFPSLENTNGTQATSWKRLIRLSKLEKKQLQKENS